MTGDMMDDEEIRKMGQDIRTLVRIGKNGINESMVDEINRHLEDKDLVKVKVLRNNPIQDLDKVAEELEEKTDGRLIEIRGKTILLYNPD